MSEFAMTLELRPLAKLLGDLPKLAKVSDAKFSVFPRFLREDDSVRCGRQQPSSVRQTLMSVDRTDRSVCATQTGVASDVLRRRFRGEAPLAQLQLRASGRDIAGTIADDTVARRIRDIFELEIG